MSQTVSFNRMPRIQEALPESEVKIPGPPTISPLPAFSWLQALLPVAGLFIMVGIYGAIYENWLLAIPMIAMSGVSTLTSIIGRRVQRKNHTKQAAEKEAAYTAALDQRRGELELMRLEQQRILSDTDPDLTTLLTRARAHDPRLWERRPEDADGER